jgi:hypothetical protein
VVNHLNRNSKRQWLMIVDNADDYSHFFPLPPDGTSPRLDDQSYLASFIPQSGTAARRIIITPRDKKLGRQLSQTSRISVQSLPLPEAITLFSTKIQDQARRSYVDAEKLVMALDCHPLAITQAAAFINQFDDFTSNDYLRTLEDLETMSEALSEDLHDARRAPGMPNAIFKTWRVSYDLLNRDHPAAADLLCLMATLDNSAIPSRLLRTQDEVTLEDRKKVQTLLISL